MAGAANFPLRSESVNLTTDYTFAIKAITEIYVGGSGNLVATLVGDSGSVTYAVTAGQILPGAFKSVTKVGTTATGLIGRSAFPNDG